MSQNQLQQSLKSDQVNVISLTAAYLNTLIESIFAFKIEAKSNQNIIGALEINNKKFSGFLIIPLQYLEHEINLFITNNENQCCYQVNVKPHHPLVVAIPQEHGEPVVFTMQLISGTGLVTGSFHASMMREAALTLVNTTTTIDATEAAMVAGNHTNSIEPFKTSTTSEGNQPEISPRLSINERKLSIAIAPRRVTKIGSSQSLLGTGKAIASTKKTLLYLEDSEHHLEPTSDIQIIGGIQAATQIDPISGQVISNRTILNHHETFFKSLNVFASKLSPRRASVGGGTGIIQRGPTFGSYIVCNSKSEILNIDTKEKKMNKKQLLQINLGLMEVSKSALHNALKLRANLVDLVFDWKNADQIHSPRASMNNISPRETFIKIVEDIQHDKEPNSNDNPEVTATNAALPSHPLVDNTNKEEKMNEANSKGQKKDGKYQQKALIAYNGFLTETSRQVYAESGLTVVTLEGNLFLPSGQMQLDQESRDGDNDREGSKNEASAPITDVANVIEEPCIAVKLFVSLVPSKSVPLQSQSTESNSKTELSDNKPEAVTQEPVEEKPEVITQEPVEEKPEAITQEPVEEKPEAITQEPVEEKPEVITQEPVEEKPEVITQEPVEEKPEVITQNASEQIAEKLGEQPTDKSSKSDEINPTIIESPSISLIDEGRNQSNINRPINETSFFVSGRSTSRYNDNELFNELKGNSVLSSPTKKLTMPELMEVLHPNTIKTTTSSIDNHHHDSLKSLNEELMNKQMTIEQLRKDIEMYSEAMQVCGYDIRSLREEKLKMMEIIDKMVQEKDQKIEEENKVSTITSEILKTPGLIHELDKSVLVRILNQLRKQYQELEIEKDILQNTLKQAKSHLEKYAILKKDYINLEEAHIEQSKYIQKINNKINQIQTYENTIQTQEKVIFKMQNILENNIKANGLIITKPIKNNNDIDFTIVPTPPNIDKDDLHINEKQELIEAKEEISLLHDQIKELKQQLLHENHNSKMNNNEELLSSEENSVNEDVLEELKDAQHQIDQLEAENVSQSYKIAALESQLKTTTQEYAKELARLKTVLFEYEMDALSNENNKEQVPLLDLTQLNESQVNNNSPVTLESLSKLTKKDEENTSDDEISIENWNRISKSGKLSPRQLEIVSKLNDDKEENAISNDANQSIDKLLPKDSSSLDHPINQNVEELQENLQAALGNITSQTPRKTLVSPSPRSSMNMTSPSPKDLTPNTTSQSPRTSLAKVTNSKLYSPRPSVVASDIISKSPRNSNISPQTPVDSKNITSQSPRSSMNTTSPNHSRPSVVQASNPTTSPRNSIIPTSLLNMVTQSPRALLDMVTHTPRALFDMISHSPDTSIDINKTPQKPHIETNVGNQMISSTELQNNITEARTNVELNTIENLSSVQSQLDKIDNTIATLSARRPTSSGTLAVGSGLSAVRSKTNEE